MWPALCWKATTWTNQIIASGQGVLAEEYRMRYFPGDDLLSALRPRGLPMRSWIAHAAHGDTWGLRSAMVAGNINDDHVTKATRAADAHQFQKAPVAN
jgi:hypothetical protein